MRIDVSRDRRSVLVNELAIASAPPINALIEVLGKASRVDGGVTPAPWGHRNNQIHVFDDLGVYVNEHHFTVEDLVARARGGDAKAVAAIEGTARYLGLGLASVINVLNPSCVYIGGEITLAWDLISGAVRTALAERALTPAAAQTELRPVVAAEHPRLMGAAALVSAPAFAAPVVA